VEGVRLHDLRHWMATQGLGDDTDIKTVAARGGWANTTTPLEMYAAFVPARDAALALRLAKLLDGEGTDGNVNGEAAGDAAASEAIGQQG
jgi:integrase